MRFLADAQLLFWLAQYLQQMGVEAVHTAALPLANRTPDSELKRLSVEGSCVAVTKDSDFVNNLLLHDNVYKLLLGNTGNISNPSCHLQDFFSYEVEAAGLGQKGEP